MIPRHMSQIYSFNKVPHFSSGHSLKPCLIQIKFLTLNFFLITNMKDFGNNG